MDIKKTIINSKTHKLSDAYTVDYTQDVEHVIGDEIEKAINDEVMNQIAGPALLEQGWTLVIVKDWQRIPQEWIDANLSRNCNYNCFGYYWYFELESDATLFALNWK